MIERAIEAELPAPGGRKSTPSGWAGHLKQNWRPVVLVLLPFACAYYLSYLYRTINALIADQLRSDLGLGAADLGLLTSIYFLTFAALQLPLGVWLDRYGPRRVQSVLMLSAAGGSALFGAAHGFAALVIGRAMIGLGAAAALMAGIKAVALWFPKERQTLVNGCLVTLGSLGAVTATAPAEQLLAWIGWRGMFELLAPTTALCALLIYFVVPEPVSVTPAAKAPGSSSLAIFADRRFWRLAPLSATCIGAAWSLQGLWASSWLADVDGLERSGIVRHLFVMAVALSASALLIGIGADRLRRRGVRAQALLALTATLFIATQLALILRLPIPSYLLWSIVAGAGSVTVLSFAILSEGVPKEAAGRANGALSVFNIGAAFVLQSATGMIVQLWSSQGGHYPAVAYQTAFAANLALQIAALIWFVRPSRRAVESASAQNPFRHPSPFGNAVSVPIMPYRMAGQLWIERQGSARAQAASWRLAALGSIALSALLGLTLAVSVCRASVTPYIVDVARLGEPNNINPAMETNVPSDAQIAYFLTRFVKNVRSLSVDPIVVRENWMDALRYVTDRGAQTLSDYARDANPFAKIGARAITVDVIYVVRASSNSFEIRWREQTYEGGRIVKIERFTGLASIIIKSSSTPETLSKNPLGMHVQGLYWSPDLATNQTR